jgi:hypothetical protein
MPLTRAQVRAMMNAQRRRRQEVMNQIEMANILSDFQAQRLSPQDLEAITALQGMRRRRRSRSPRRRSPRKRSPNRAAGED